MYTVLKWSPLKTDYTTQVIVFLTRSDWLTRRWWAKLFPSKQRFWNFGPFFGWLLRVFFFTSYSTSVVRTKTIIHYSHLQNLNILKHEELSRISHCKPYDYNGPQYYIRSFLKFCHLGDGIFIVKLRRYCRKCNFHGVNIRIGHSDLSKSSAYNAVFTALGLEYNISEFGY